MRLDRFLNHKTRLGRRTILQLLADGRVSVDGERECFHRREVDHFTHVMLDDEVLQDTVARYVMLHKPAGYLSATSDPEHPTVIELIPEDYASQLHIAGRLDRASTGLLLLTNDGRWSRALTEPERKVSKVYQVSLRDPVTPAVIDTFEQGIYFAYEDLTTQPVELSIHDPHHVEITLTEGRYHQIKRMFHAIGNQVVSLHRSQIGALKLEASLAVGSYQTIDPKSPWGES